MTTAVFVPDPADIVPHEDMREDIRAYVIERAGQDVPFTDIHREIMGLYSLATVREWWEQHLEWQRVTPPPLPTSTIIGCFGRRGSGKSLVAAWIAYEEYLSGRPVIYNPEGLLKFPPLPGCSAQFLGLKQIAMMDEVMHGALLVLDEIQINLSKYRSSTTASLLLRRVIQQTRKIGMDMIVTSNAPGDLDPSFGPQLDIYGTCKSYFPPRYPGQDAIGVQWVDAQKQFGVGAIRSIRGHYIDNRIRLRAWLWPASKMFPLFDTTVATSPLAVMGLTPDEMREADVEKQAGVTTEELANFIRTQLVPDLVAGGIETIQPAVITTWIAETYDRGADHAKCCGALTNAAETPAGCDRGVRLPLAVTPDMFGRACKYAGLHGVRRASGMIYRLPPLAKLALWQSGLWTEDAAA